MKTKIFFLNFVLLAVLFACGSQPSVSVSLRSNPAQTLSILPTLTSTPTPTPLPSIPDFQDLIRFLGGGGGPRDNYPGFSPAIVIERAAFEPAANLYLWGFHFDLPFQLQLISPDGSVFKSSNIWVERSTGEVHWEGFEGFLGHASMSADPIYILLSIWWPNNFPSGQWHVSTSGDGLQVAGDFLVEARNSPSLDVLDTRPSNQIVPVDGRWPIKEDGRGELVGLNYPPQAPVYLLLYHETPANDLQFELINKQVVISDPAGRITAELDGLFESDEQFLVIGISDSGTRLSDYTFGTMPYPFDTFRVASSRVNARPFSYTLQPGEFVYCVARRFNVDPAELLSLNGLVSSQTFYSGLVLKIPQIGKSFPGNRSLKSHPATYTVISSRETLGSVACQFGDVDPADIADANGISSNVSLFAGQQLMIP